MAVKEAARIAQSQLASMPERVAVVETKVDSMIVCIEQIKSDVKEMHDCLDNTRDLLADKLEKMQEEYRANSSKYFEHANKLHEEDIATDKKLAGKIEDLEKFKSKWTMYVMALLAFGAGTGWIGHVNLPMVLKFLGV
jgi:chromosome segregation ATPase